ncbi:MAG: tetratricopeptide repeat protein [Acidovorax sp.]|uniref:SEL1-like repeat protein n=1 Tax=Acidovorax sp. TaxID=1872122 RepID=UPI0039E5BEC6
MIHRPFPGLALLLAAVLAAPTHAQPAGKAALRFRCDGDNVGAAVHINGQFKGECPFDVGVAEGTLKIRAVKPEGPEHERVFEQEVRVGADTVKNVEVQLGPQRLTAEGQRLRDERAAAARRAEEARQAEVRRQEAERAAQAAEAERQRLAQLERQRAAAEGGDAEAMATLALRYEKGRDGAPRDRVQAFAWYKKAAEAGSVAGMGGLGAMYFNGWGVAHDYIQAEHWWRKAAQTGDGRAMNGLAQLYYWGYGGLPEDPAEGLRWLTAASDTGYTLAQINLGNRLLQGTGATKDPARGMALLEQAAHQGEPDAFSIIGYAYETGAGVAQSDAQALRWYSQGAEQGCATCINNLGAFYGAGRGGLGRDQAEAVKLYRRAADMGSGIAMRNMGLVSLSGDGVPLDRIAALRWFRKAAEEGFQQAAALVYQLEVEEGVQPDGGPQGLFCYAMVSNTAGRQGAVMSPVWQNARPDKSAAAQQATLAQFSSAMHKASPEKWNDLASVPAQCVGNGFCSQQEKKLFGTAQVAFQWCHPVAAVMHSARAKLMKPGIETTPWVPGGASAR